MTAPIVTGIGAVASNGLTIEEHWAATLAGHSGIDRITRFDPTNYPVTLGGQVRDFTAADHIPGGLIVQTDHWTHLGLFVAERALSDAGVDPTALDEYEMAVVTASSSGGTEFGQREIEALWQRGPRHVGPFQSIAWFYAATTGQISIRHGMRGPCGVIATEQAGGLDAVAQARRLLRDDARLVVAGGTDASLCPYGLVAQLSSGRLSHCDDPARAYLPFHGEASGYVPGEGGAIVIVEDAEHARRRGAPKRYGQIAGYAATFDPGGRAHDTLCRAVRGALDDARVRPEDVDVVFADAVAVPELDTVEAAVLAEVFGPHGVPVSAPKSLVGRLHAGGSALDLAAALLSIRDGVIPPTGGPAPAARYQLDLVTEAREARLRTALVVARGYGGFNASLVVQAA
jgi:act minimal PKS chain-length factor (CLF/KS beta)